MALTIIDDIINNRQGQEKFTDVIKRFGLQSLSKEYVLNNYSGDVFGIMSWLRKCPDIYLNSEGLIEREKWPEWDINYLYNAKGQLLKKIDQDSLTWYYEYNSLGQKIREQRPGRSTHWFYDRVTETWLWEYDSSGRVVREERGNGDICEWVYAEEGLVKKNIIAKNKQSFSLVYKKDGIQTIEMLGDTEISKTATIGDETHYLDCRSETTDITKDGLLIRRESPRGIFEWKYNRKGNVTQVLKDGKALFKNTYMPCGILPLKDKNAKYTYEWDGDRIISVTKNDVCVFKYIGN